MHRQLKLHLSFESHDKTLNSLQFQHGSLYFIEAGLARSSLQARVVSKGGHVLGVPQLMVLAPLGAEEKVPIVGGLLERRRHEVVLRFPFLAVVCDLREPLVDGRGLAILVGPRNGVEENGRGNHSTREIETGLCQHVSC